MRQFLSYSKERDHPNLRNEGYRVTSESTEFKPVHYNCVAWAAIADTQKWWEPGDEPDFFWPRGILDDGSFQSYVELYKLLGYRPSNSRRLELFYEKVALFAFADGDFAHVAYQLLNGWTSKLGEWEDIRHKTLSGLEGGTYHAVSQIMKMGCGLRGFLSRAFFQITSRLWSIDRETLHRT